MTKLTILRGVSGSGKSTWARQQNAVVVSRDDLRVAFFGSDGADYYAVPKDVLREREDFISTVEQAAIKNALRAGKDVISDNTHTMAKYVNRVAKIGWADGAEVEIKMFEVPLATVLERVKRRAESGGRDVPIDTIKRQHDQLSGSRNFTLQPPPPVIPYNGTPGKPDAILLDIDGTLATMGERSPYDWKSVGIDSVNEPVQKCVHALKESGYTIIVMSGRDAVCRNETIEWLNQHIEYDHLFMRPEKDMRADNIIKPELFDAHVRDHFNVVFCLDDRDQVVETYRRMGLPVFQVNYGDF